MLIKAIAHSESSVLVSHIIQELISDQLATKDPINQSARSQFFINSNYRNDFDFKYFVLRLENTLEKPHKAKKSVIR